MAYYVNEDDLNSIEWGLDEIQNGLDKWVKDYKKEKDLTEREKHYIFRILMYVGPTFAALEQLRNAKKSSTIDSFVINTTTSDITMPNLTDYYKLSPKECELWTPTNK